MEKKEDPKAQDFLDRLQAARTNFEDRERASGNLPPKVENEGAARSGRAGSELLANVFAGAFLGFLFDKFFATAPWGMIAMMVLGFISGVVRANATLQNKNKKG